MRFQRQVCEQRRVNRGVENPSLGEAFFGREESFSAHPKGALPSEGFSTPRLYLVGLILLLSLFVFLMPAHAQTPPLDRETIYQKALTTYTDTPRQPLAIKTVETKTLDGVRFLRFSYLSAYGQRVPALLFMPLPASAKTPAPCLVLLHGLGGSKETLAGMALFVAKYGYASLVIDEYGQGERTPSKPSSRSQAEELAMTVHQSALDVRRGLDYLGTRRDIDSKRLGLVGISLGAIIGTVAAGVEPRLKAAALISGGGNWGLILKTLTASRTEVGGHSTAGFQNMDWAKVSALLAPEDPLTFAPHIAPRALLLVGGRKDTTIVPQAQQELYDAARLPKQILWFDQYGHVPPPEVVYPALQKFFAARL